MKHVLFILAAFLLNLLPATSKAAEYVYIVENDHLSAPNKLLKIRTSSMTVAREMDVYRDFYSIALSSDGSRLWGSCKNVNYILLVNTRTFEKITTIDLGDIILNKPAGIACTSNNRAYVAYSETGEVGIYNATTGAYIDTISVGGAPMRIFISPDESFAYLVNYQGPPPKITVLRLSDNQVLKNITFGGTSIQEGVFSPDGSLFYLANMSEGQIERIRTSDHTALTAYTTSDINPRSLGITPDGSYLFVGHYNGTMNSPVNMWKLSTWSIVDSVNIPYNARFIAVREDGTRLYVSEHSGNQCYAFDVSGESLTYSDHLDMGSGFVSMNLVINEELGDFPWVLFYPAILKKH
jgi:DNA-binding beta-propeller fold protein YncE